MADKSQKEELSAAECIALSTLQIHVFNANDQLISIGTGFLFSFLGNKPCERKPMLITNKHVPQEGAYVKLRFSTTKDGQTRSGDFLYKTIGGFESWIKHPDLSVDLCMLPIAPALREMEQKGVAPLIRYFTPDTVVKGTEWCHFKQMDDVTMVGYPRGIYDEKNNQPIFRKGSLATNPSLDYRGERIFLIDMAVYPGSSGSPVLSVQEGPIVDRKTGSVSFQMGGMFRCYLLGIVSKVFNPAIFGSIELKSVANQPSFIHVAKTPIPINLGLVIKADQILELETLL